MSEIIDVTKKRKSQFSLCKHKKKKKKNRKVIAINSRYFVWYCLLNDED